MIGVGIGLTRLWLACLFTPKAEGNSCAPACLPAVTCCSVSAASNAYVFAWLCVLQTLQTTADYVLFVLQTSKCLYVCLILYILLLLLLCFLLRLLVGFSSPMAADGVEQKHDRWVGHRLVVRRTSWCSLVSGRTLRLYYYCCTYVSQYAVSNMQHATVLFCISVPVATCSGFCSKQAIGQPAQNASKPTTVAAGNLRVGVWFCGRSGESVFC